MMYASIQMKNGEVLDGNKIGELVQFIVNKFSEAGLNHDEAKEILRATEDELGACSKVQKIH